MTSIDIDFDVFKALTLRRASEEISYNDVLRDLLGLGSKRTSSMIQELTSTDGDWVTKGVHFPNGTEFRATYKGKIHYAKVESGILVLEGRRYDSPSSAAVSITGNPVNGWVFWECRFPGRSSWQMIKSLRK